MGLERAYYKKVFRRDEVAECLASKELKLRAGVLLKGKAMSAKVTQQDAAQRAVTDMLQSMEEYYEVVAG